MIERKNPISYLTSIPAHWRLMCGDCVATPPALCGTDEVIRDLEPVACKGKTSHYCTANN